jgi:allantoicase
MIEAITHSLQPMDFACVETQIGDGSKADCEIVNINEDIVVDVSKFI